MCIQSISKGNNSRQTDDRTDGCSGTFACTLYFLWWPSINVSSFIYFPSILSEICFGQAFYCKKKGTNSVHTGDRVMVLASCNSLHGPLSVYQVSFIYIQYFKRYAPYKLTIAKIRNGNNSLITCDRSTVLTLCTSSDGHLSMYQVSFNSLSEICSGQAFYCKIKKRSNSLNTGDRAMVLAIPSKALYQCIKFHSFIFNTFWDMLQTSLLYKN